MLRRTLTTALATVAVAVTMAAPAHADPNPPYTPTTLTVTGVTTGFFLNGLQISATCEADALGLVAAVVIDECRIYQNGVPDPNHPAGAPGNAAASTFTQPVYTLMFQLCYSAYTIPLHNPAQVIRTPRRCGGFPVAGGVTIGESTTTE